MTSLHPVLICVCHLTLAHATSAHVCGTSVVLGPWYSVRVLIQHSVIAFRATSMAHTDNDAINNKKRVQFLSCNRSTGSCICLSSNNQQDAAWKRNLLFHSTLKAQHVSSDMSLIIRSPNCIYSLWFTYVCGDRP